MVEKLAPYRGNFSQECAYKAKTANRPWIYQESGRQRGQHFFSLLPRDKGASSKRNGQQNEQQLGQQTGQQTGHNLETQIPDLKIIKETPNVTPKVVDRSPFSDKQKSDLQGLLAYCQDKQLRISERALRRWIRLYESERITDHLLLLLQGIDGIKKPEAWMEVALKENYSQQNSNIKENRLFTEDFARRNNWNDIKITQVLLYSSALQQRLFV